MRRRRRRDGEKKRKEGGGREKEKRSDEQGSKALSRQCLPCALSGSLVSTSSRVVERVGDGLIVWVVNACW